MATQPGLVTVEEFRDLPLDEGAVMYELHHGEVVAMSRPKAKHYKLQTTIEDLLRPRAQHLGVIQIEVPFRALPQFDFRCADVAFVSRARWEAIDPEDNLRAAPELVIEVKSESNTWAELRERASLCLANGCLEFWMVDGKSRTITVITPDGKSVEYTMADRIPLSLFGGEPLAVADVFR